MSKTIKAKFTVITVTTFADGSKQVILNAAIHGEENKEWSKWTPSGEIKMNITNPDVEFEFGDYYLTLEKAE